MNQTFTSLPDGLNGFIFYGQRGVVSTSLPQDLPVADLKEVGRILSRFYTMIGTEPVKDIRLAFESVSVWVRQIDEDVFAVILNPADVSEEEMAERMDRHLPAFFKGRPRPGASANGSQALTPEYIEEQLHFGPVSAQLQALSTRLFQSAGPVARVIFRDALRQWLGGGPPRAERLEGLVGIVMREIRDPERAEAYRAGLPRDLTAWEI